MRRIRTRLIVIIFALAGIPILVVAAVITRVSASALDQVVVGAVDNAASLVQREVETYLTIRESQLQLLVETQDLSDPAQWAAIETLLFYDRVYQELALLDASGQQVARFSRHEVFSPADLLDQSDTPAFRAVQDNMTIFYGDVSFDPAIREPVITVALPVIDLRSGELTHVLTAVLSFRPIWDLIANINLGEDIEAMLVAPDGRIIAHRDPSIVLQGIELSPVPEPGEGRNLQDERVLRSRELISLGETHILVLAESPVSQAQALERASQQIALTGMLVALTTAAGVLFIVVPKVVRPIEQLGVVARQIGEGNRRARAHVTNQDEIGMLAQTFNVMADQIDELISGLEERVATRTRYLDVAADISRQISTLLNLNELLPVLAERTCRGFHADGVTLYLYEQSTHSLVQAARVRDSTVLAAPLPELLSVATCATPAAQAARTRAPELAEQMAAFPLIQGSDLVGVLHLEYRSGHGTSDDDAHALQSLSSQLAVAVQNAQLYARQISTNRQLTAALDDARAAHAAAEEANQMKSRFLANMSHELRTPLNSIINFTYMLHEGFYGPVSRQQMSYLSRVQSSGEHLLSLINDILDISKIEAGRVDLYKEPMKVRDLVVSMMSTAKGLVKDKPITLHEEVEPDLPIVQADPKRMRQVLLNLLANAAKFTDEGSITLRAVTTDTAVVISVIDTGIGIPADKLDTIFEEFRQADEGSSRSYQGTGLGLAICKRLVALHGGTIQVASTPHAGSTFSFTLPLHADTPEHVPPELVDTYVEPHRLVLMIDDDPTVVDTMHTYIRETDYIVLVIPDNLQVVEEIQRQQPVAVLLNLTMSQRSGWQVLAELKANPLAGTIPIVLYMRVGTEQHICHLDVTDYLLKPLSESSLRQSVLRLVGKHAHILAIDDDPAMLNQIQTLLGTGHTWQVTAVDGGEAGIAAARQMQPDLIMLDLMMPEVDGLAVLAALQAEPAASTIPIIMLTPGDLTLSELLYLQQRVLSIIPTGAPQPRHLLNQIDRARAI